jgi:hypothetical protein
MEGRDGTALGRALWRDWGALTKGQRPSGRCGSGSTDDRLDSLVTGVRSDGDVSSLDGGTGGATPGNGAPSDGLALSNIGGDRAGGAGLITGGADLTGGVDCALT